VETLDGWRRSRGVAARAWLGRKQRPIKSKLTEAKRGKRPGSESLEVP
jgi:hypothetical protein